MCALYFLFANQDGNYNKVTVGKTIGNFRLELPTVIHCRDRKAFSHTVQIHNSKL